MDEKKLYPLRFLPLTDEYAWGSDNFLLADLGYRDSIVRDGWLSSNTLSEVMDTYMDRVVGDKVFSVYGRQFPVQVKTIVCKGRMPLRVHPDDEIASSRYDSLGREKLWYILSASPDALVWLGWKESVDATVIMEGAADGSIAGKLNAVRVKAGDVFRIHPGVVHGAMGQLEILEISQSSALDFCLCSWGQALTDVEFDESMNLPEALDFIEYSPYLPDADPASAPAPMKTLMDIPQFTARKIALHQALHISGEGDDSFAVYYCLYGGAAVKADIEGLGNVQYPIGRGELLLVPAEVDDFILEPLEQNTAVIEVLSETHPAADPYIRPGVAPKLDDDSDE